MTESEVQAFVDGIDLTPDDYEYALKLSVEAHKRVSPERRAQIKANLAEGRRHAEAIADGRIEPLSG